MLKRLIKVAASLLDVRPEDMQYSFKSSFYEQNQSFRFAVQSVQHSNGSRNRLPIHSNTLLVNPNIQKKENASQGSCT